MTNQFSQIQWGRVILTALGVYIFSFLIVFLIVTVYASSLAFQARGAPDQGMIEVFANQYAPWVGSISVILLTFLGAIWMARRVGDAIPLHGIILGLLVSLISIIFDEVSLNTLLTAVITIAAGWLGSQSGTRR